MRWESLFEDMEGRLAAAERAELDADVADRIRSERAAVGLADRLRAQEGRTIAVHIATGERLDGEVLDAGADWVLIATAGRTETLIPLHAVRGVLGLSAAAAGGELARRLGVGVVLRGLARERVAVRLGLLDGRIVTGTLDRVGLDHLDIAVHDADEPRRTSAVAGVQAVPFAALAYVRAR